MSTDPTPRNDVERLFQQLVDAGGVSLTVLSGDGLFSVGLRGTGHETPRCSCHEDLWIAATDNWTLYARLGSVRQVRFAREPDPHAPERETLSVRFTGPNGVSMLRASFTPLYDDRSEPIAAQFARWDALRAQFGGRDELPVKDGAFCPP